MSVGPADGGGTSLRAQMEIEAPEARLVEGPEPKATGSWLRWLLLVMRIGLTVAVVGLLVVFSGAISGGKSKKRACVWTGPELPGWATPVSYRVDLDVKWSSPYDVFGQSEVDVIVHEPTSCVVIHSTDMSVSHVTIPGLGTGNITHDGYYGRIMVEFPFSLPEPRTTIQFKFHYSLGTQAHGFHRSEFKDEEGAPRQIALTNFGTRGARKTFPCFDDPRLKATFEISLTAPSGLSCLSNMPLKSSEKIGLRRRHSFEATPKMPTYLIGWVILNYVSLERQVKTMSGMKPFRIWGPEHNVPDLEETLKIASLVIPFYEEIFQTPYPLPKLDLVTIPHYRVGGLENWGLITIGMADVLINPRQSSSHDWTRVALRIAHECAHMWFGDLVTVEHWGDLWLSEGFADYFKFFGADVGLPGLDSFASFFASETVSSFRHEIATQGHPLALAKEDNYVNGIEQANFDAITYNKGASILRMLHAYLNHIHPPVETQDHVADNTAANDIFLMGIKSFIDQFKFGNAQTQDFWKSMSGATGLPLSDLMHKWSYEPGFPVLSVSIDSSNTIFVKQRPHYGSECNTGWWIPISFTTNALRQTQWAVMDGCQEIKLATLVDENDFPVLNLGRYGYYKVHYPDQIKSRLFGAVADDDSILGSEDVTGMLLDAYSPDMMTHVNMSDFLDLALQLGRRRAPAYSPWSYCLDKLFHIIRLLRLGHKGCAAMGADFILHNILSPVEFESLNVPDYNQGMLRGDIVHIQGIFGDQNVITAGRRAFSEPGTVDVDLKKGYYRAAVADGDEELYNQVLGLYLYEKELHEKNRLMYALGSASNPTLIARTLDLAMGNDVEIQDTISLIIFVSRSSKFAAEMALDFVVENYRAIGEKLGGWKSHGIAIHRYLVPSLASNFASADKADQIRRFYEDHSQTHKKQPYKDMALSQIKTNRLWLTKHAEEACSWFAAH